VAASPAPAAKSLAKPIPKSKRKFGIALYQAWCKRCGICGEFCPTGSIVNDELGMPSVADEDKCVGCMQCMQRCPDFCVEVHEKKAAPASGAAKSEPKE
jgi:2-oxoglutarate ferredoxin oxidoreductase subunit delta